MKTRTVDPTITPRQAKRFWTKVQRGGDDECWPWLAYKDVKGYGSFWIGRESEGLAAMTCAHRVAFRLVHDSIPQGLSLDHLCRNPACVNPAHLEPVTHEENMRRGEGAPAKNGRKTRCPRCGAEFTNLIRKRTGRPYRRCDPCARKAAHDYYHGKKKIDGSTYDPVRKAGTVTIY